MPRSRQVTRTVRAFVCHGRVLGGEILDYVDYFDWVGHLPPAETLVELGAELSAAIDAAHSEGGLWYFRLVSGNPGVAPLFYSERSGSTEELEIDESRWVATATRLVVDPSSRLVALEIARGGLGAANIERFFSRISARGAFGERTTIDLNPLPSPSFAQELDKFTRIREASLVVRRPNTDWDEADDVLSSLADNSAGHQASVGVQAARGESLRKGRGIVQLIRDHLTRPLSNVADARVTGVQEGSTAPTTVSLERHQLHARVDVPRPVTSRQADEIIFESERLLLDDARAIDIAAERPGET